jgi:hypothetical protein
MCSDRNLYCNLYRAVCVDHEIRGIRFKLSVHSLSVWVYSPVTARSSRINAREHFLIITPSCTPESSFLVFKLSNSEKKGKRKYHLKGSGNSHFVPCSSSGG